MKVLIADDHAVFRRGLKETLSEAFSHIVFGEARTGHETLELARRQSWDVIILDISRPGRSGLEILDDLRRALPKIPVLLLTMHPEQQFARRALKAGAAGYLTKDSVPDELKEAIKRIVAGGRYVSATFAGKPAGGLWGGGGFSLSPPPFPPRLSVGGEIARPENLRK